MPLGCSLSATVRQPESVVGLTHASSVSADVRSSELESGTSTRLEPPLKDSALPNLPSEIHDALLTAPVLPLPDASAVEDPDPSSKPHAPTRPDEALAMVAAACAVARPMFPAASSAATR